MSIVEERSITLNGKEYKYHHRIYGGKDTIFIGDYPAYDFIAWLTTCGLQDEKDELAAIGLEVIIARITSEENFIKTKDEREAYLRKILEEQKTAKLN